MQPPKDEYKTGNGSPANSSESADAVEGRTPGARGPARDTGSSAVRPKSKEREIGGPRGPEPTRYGDWERKGRCIDF
jgi:hypothetical protein